MHESLRDRLFSLQDTAYRDFHSRLIPNIDPERVIGIRTPALRAFAKEFSKTNEDAKVLVDRLLYETEIIKQMGYVDYFLIVWDFIKYAVDNGIPTGAGRGSAAGSIVSYTLDITKIDPMKYGLLFERELRCAR